MIADKASEFLISKMASGVAELNVVISASYLIPLYAVGTVLITISVLVSSWTIIRLKPKDILTKMS